ncbi:sulfonate transport system permease protein [Novosphingobium chloroacetimidivorans]|uniref:Sulfonate transport system permease protein n=1 Tax=Novosphingobium chloroacetimidivorans TaxID=1428314 RepID=A0A7W7K9Z2_9SPHN|nr:ABC transporter permease [Novosphingobium chloroacetimidivorans]MBB4858925.1 sulfonate transport system permease protein [Novosphingobium chloroacetimidivorans]
MASTAELLHPPFPKHPGPLPGLGYHRPRPVLETMPTVPPLQRGKYRLGLPRAWTYGWLLGPAMLLAYWAVGSTSGFIDSRILPAPWVAVTTGIDLLQDGRLHHNVLVSALRAAQGLFFGATLGVAVAFLSGLSLVGGYLFDSVIQLKRAIPTLALIPFFILWFGVGETMKVTMIGVFVFLPIYVHTHNALRGIDLRFVELAETMRISYLEYLRHVVLPGALPGIMLGLRFGVMAAWVSLVVVEQINTTSGIGYMINLARNYAQSDVMLVGLLLYAVLGLASDFAVRLVERKVLSWRRTLGQ